MRIPKINFKRAIALIIVVLLAIEAHSYWQFRYMLSEYFSENDAALQNDNKPAFRLIEPLVLAPEVIAVRGFHYYQHLSGFYAEPDREWRTMSEDEIYEYIGNTKYESGNSNGVGGQYFRNDQSHFSGCSDIHIVDRCFRKFVIMGNVVCSFPENLSITLSEVKCFRFFSFGESIYKELAGAGKFLRNPLVKISGGE